MSNPLWEYSLANYAREGVAPACLALQDEFDLDVNLLLYAAWLASLGLRLEPAHLAQLEEQVSDWRDNVVRPLRALRRQLCNYSPAADIRERIKTLELEAEEEQQAMMYSVYQLAIDIPREDRSVLANLRLVAAHNGASDVCWRPAIECLAVLLEPGPGGVAPRGDG